jgi:ribonuclease G
MSKEMIVSVNGREKKIAILDNGRVTEFYIERGEENSGVAGNVYKGRVMRVLPGMQSAFVDVGLERDAFLYVSDFFDEDEEIERIVMEKAKKGSAEDAKREANEQIDRSRIEREKQMESVQEIAEPMREGAQRGSDSFDEEARDDKTRSGGRFDRKERAEEPEEPREEKAVIEEPQAEAVPEKGKRARGRGKRGKAEEIQSEPEAAPAFVIEYDNAGFERISDDSDTGEMFKDAFIQEAIIDRVRAVEFDMEGTAEAEVGSLLAEVETDLGGFERIADDDEDVAAPAKGRGRAKKTPDAEAKAPAKRKAAPKRGPSKGKFSKSSKTKKAKDGDLPDAEASHRESDGNAEMAVRRGGRGGRRRTTKKNEEGGEEGSEGTENVEMPDDGAVEMKETSEAVVEMAHEEREAEPQAETDDQRSEQQSEPTAERERSTENKPRGRDGRGGRDRNTRESSSRESNDSGNRDSGNRDTGNRESSGREVSGNRDSGPRDNTTRDNRDTRGRRDTRGGRSDRPGGDGKRFDRNDRSGGRPPQPTISDLLKEGQEILVQIAKEPIAKKGARITSHIALPGRYLVYMPTIEHLGVSRKIESASERSRLRTLIQRIRQDDEIPSGGFIVRTAGIGIAEEDLRNDAKYLARMWADARKNSEKKKSPTLVHQDLDLVQRILRDQLADNFTAIRVDNEEEYLLTVEFINLIQPRMVNRIKLFTRDEPILEYYGFHE